MSEIAATLKAGFETHVMPVLGALGFTLVKPKNVRPGLVAVAAHRQLDGERRLEAQLWCDGGTGASLHLRAPSGSVAQHVLELVRLPYDEAPTLNDE